MRVLHFVSSIKVVDFFRGLAAHRDRAALDFQVCTLDGPGPLQEVLGGLGVRGHALGVSRRALYPLAILKLARLLRRERIDVLHTHLFDPSVVGLVAGVLARTPARVMTRWYSDLHVVLRRPVHTRIDARTARLAHAVIAISEYTKEVLVKVEGVAAERVRVIYPAIADVPGVARPASPDAGVCRLGVVARLHPVKDHHSLLLAFRKVLDACPRSRLQIIGEGPLEGELKALATELGIDKAVEFAGFHSDMEQVYAGLDVLVHPAIEEAFGFVLVEAMARGLPVVCTPRGIAAEIVQDGVSGLLVPVRDPAALAERIIRLVESPELRARVGAAARDATVGRFSYAATTAAYEQLYREVLSRR